MKPKSLSYKISGKEHNRLQEVMLKFASMSENSNLAFMLILFPRRSVIWSKDLDTLALFAYSFVLFFFFPLKLTVPFSSTLQLFAEDLRNTTS